MGGVPAPGRLRRIVVWAVALALLYAAFEAGRFVAGHSAWSAMIRRQALSRRIADLEATRTDLERRLGASEVLQRADHEAQAEAQAALGELQAELARQQQELDFYRGLVTEKFGAGTIRVQELAVRPEGDTRYTVVVTLVQTASRDAIARGTLSLTIDGSRGGALAQLGMADVTADGRQAVDFSLRYFTTLEVPVELPAGFTPAAVQLEYRTDRGGPEPQRQSFPWRTVIADLAAVPLTPDAKAD